MRIKDKGVKTEVQFYEWNAHRWLGCDSRHELDPAARGIYRDCLDLCYCFGSIPKNLRLLASKCLCSVDEMERVWPLIARHFSASKNDPEQLTNAFADIFRRRFKTYVNGQRVKRIQAINKAKADKELHKVASTELQATLEQPSTAVVHNNNNNNTNNKTNNNNDKKRTVEASSRAVLDDFGVFWQAFIECGLPFSDYDIEEARIEWGRLDFEQRVKATKGLSERKQCGEFDDENFRPLPQNYLKKRIFNRPLRNRGQPTVMTKPNSTQIAAARFLGEKR